MCQQQPGIKTHWRRARENREYVRRLLSERQPVFAARLWSAERQLDLELSREPVACLPLISDGDVARAG